MTKYLTVNQYKLADDGVDLTGIPDLTLAQIIAESETDIDTAVQFDLKVGGFEPHFDTFQAAFDQETLKIYPPNFPTPIRQVTRIRVQISNLTTTGAGFFATFNASDGVIQQFEHYIELVPLQAVLYALSPVLVQLGLVPPIAQVDFEAGFFLSVFQEQLFPYNVSYIEYVSTKTGWVTDPTIYTLSSPLQPNKPAPIPPVIYRNGYGANYIVASSEYTINGQEGSISFLQAQDKDAIFYADICYVIPMAVREAAIKQTSYLLQQRFLNQMRLFEGIQDMRSDDQQIRRIIPKYDARLGSLCDAAAGKLKPYMQSYPIA